MLPCTLLATERLEISRHTGPSATMKWTPERSKNHAKKKNKGMADTLEQADGLMRHSISLSPMTSVDKSNRNESRLQKRIYIHKLDGQASSTTNNIPSFAR